MKKNRFLSLILALVMLAALLTGCGGSSENYAVREEAAAEAPMAMDNGAMSNSTTTEGSTSLPENRKWIITVNMSAETEDLDAMIAALDQQIAALKGYVEDQNIYNGSNRSSYRYRSANLTIRIPADDVDALTNEIDGIANVISKSKNLEDITLTYVATESRISVLEAEEARLLEFMEKAETMEDLLKIEKRLTEVRAELESTNSRMRLYNNQVDYATIHLSIEEVQKFTPVEEPTVWERIRDGFADSLEGVGDGLINFAVWLITSSPYLVVFGILALIGLAIGKRIKAKRIRKQAPKAEDQK